MSLSPILDAPFEIQIHVLFAIVSVFLGPFALLRQRRDRLHKVLGYIWVIAMAGLALSSFFIHTFQVIGPFSPIHLFAVFTLWSLWVGVRHAIRGQFDLHRIVFRNLYWYGLLVAGTLNFIPGRLMNQAAFGDNGVLGFAVIGAGFGGMALSLIRARQLRSAGENKENKARKDFRHRNRGAIV